MGVLIEQVRNRLIECRESSEDLLALLERNPEYISHVYKPGLRVTLANLNKILDLVNNPEQSDDEGL